MDFNGEDFGFVIRLSEIGFRPIYRLSVLKYKELTLIGIDQNVDIGASLNICRFCCPLGIWEFNILGLISRFVERLWVANI